MRDINRIDDICERLKKVWKSAPDLRLGQLIGNCMDGTAQYYIEDNELIEKLEKCYNIEQEKKENNRIAEMELRLNKIEAALNAIQQEQKMLYDNQVALFDIKDID